MKDFGELSPGSSERHPSFLKLIFWFSNIYQRDEGVDCIVEILYFSKPGTL